MKSFRERAKIKWYGMHRRVKVETNYCCVEIHPDWYDFEKFYEWILPYYKKGLVHEGWALEKDLLSGRDVKQYSPETCCFLPADINSMLTSCMTMWQDETTEVTEAMINRYVERKKKEMYKLVMKYEKMLDPMIADILLEWEPDYEM